MPNVRLLHVLVLASFSLVPASPGCAATPAPRGPTSAARLREGEAPKPSEPVEVGTTGEDADTDATVGTRGAS